MNIKNIDLLKLFNLAIKEHQSENHEEAKKLYKKILTIDASHFESNFYLGTLYAQSNNLNEALTLLNKAKEINPKVEDIHNNLGLIYRQLGEYKNAINCLRKAIEINSNYIEPYNNLGIIFEEHKDFKNAEKYFKKAIEISPEYVPAYINLGNLFKVLNEIDKSEKYYKDAINLNPKYFDAYNNLMNLYERTNKEEKLKELIKKSETQFNNNPTVNLFKGKYFYKTHNFKEAINILENVKFNKNEVNRERSRLLFLAKCHDELEDIDKSFDYFSKMNLVNTKLANNKNINKNKALEMIDKRYQFFGNTENDKWSNSKINNDEKSPIFLIGFSRSGTTLLQTILRSHPDIEVIEEEPLLNSFLNSLQKITNDDFKHLKKIDENEIFNLKQLYLSSKDKFIKNKNNNLIYIDKEPLNIIHVGEIVRVFPNAKFLVSIRHPYDCVLSCFMQNFILNDTLVNFLNLEDSANFYDKVMKLWISYINFLPINYHLIKYEDVVLDFEKTLRNALKFLDLQWSDKILNFYKNSDKDLVATPSYDQVNKPIYTRSIGKWKKYENKISKIFPILDPWVNKFNYLK